MKEYGGYLTIEQDSQEYYDESVYSGLLRFNAARYAAVYAAVLGGYRRIWIPFYLCKCVFDALGRYGISCSFYSVNDELEPVLEHIDQDEAVLIVNYFGIKPVSFYEKMMAKYRNIIFDNTQAFFAKPVIRENVYNVYSPRKFVGVADGAYLISEVKKEADLGFQIETDVSFGRMGHILSAVEKGTNSCYRDALKAEDELTLSPVRYMSKLTRAMLKGINYSFVKERRVKNFNLMVQAFDSVNEIRDLKRADITMETVPMVYPLLAAGGGDIRKKLVKEQVYCPQWWKWILEDERCKNINDVETYYAENLIPLVIDQRYEDEDIAKLVEIVNRFIRS